MHLTQGLHRALRQTPDAEMTVCGTRRRTFAQVADRIARLAGGLRALGVGSGDRVAMLALNSDRYHEYLLAVPWADAVLNPVNTRWSPAEIVYSLRDSATTVLLVDDAFAPMLPELRSAYPELTTVIHTGDGGFLDAAGYLHVVDRLKDMIISGGENVYSAEVENAVAQHPAVASCAVIGVPDDEWGERVHAVVVLQDGLMLTHAELRAHCKTLIAGYKAPRSTEFVTALPVSSTGKILKRALREAHWGGKSRQVN